MAIIKFPPLETADENGLIGIGGDLSPESLLLAYQNGIFPWPISKEYPLAWFSPDPRGILYYENLHLSQSFIKFLKKQTYNIKYNSNFEAVILNCARISRKHENSTWITDEIINAYIDFHKLGFAYSVEVYDKDRLIAGLYGVKINQYVCGESMFHIETNTSKLALYTLISDLYKNNISWLDTQMVSPVVSNMGGSYIPRTAFISLLNKSINPTT
jgi:leucyl/phenylalanyl-tRNA--protein transferase